MPGGYAADTETAVLPYSHDQIVRAWALHPSFGAVALDVLPGGWRVDFDGSRAPRVNAELTVRRPARDVLEQLDGRRGVRVTIDAGYRRPDGREDVQEFVDLGLRRVVDSDPEDEVTLILTSDEQLVIDASPAVTGTIASATEQAAIEALLADAIQPSPLVSNTATGGATVSVGPLVDRWATIADLADRVDLRVFDDGLRTWRIANTPVLGTSVLSLVVGKSGTVDRSSRARDRESWHNYVRLRYRWRDAAGAQQEIVATAVLTSGPFAATGPAGRKIFDDDREVPTTQAAANAAAQAVLLRALSRSTSYRLEAIAALWVRPGDTISVQLRDERAPQLHLVERVTFRPGGVMELATRMPEVGPEVTTTTPVGSGKTADPVPAARKRHVSVWEASDSASYKGSGVKRTDIPGELGHGYFGTTNGNQSSLALFAGANSTGSEVGKTITQALDGANLERVEVAVWCTHAWASSGMSARFGWAYGTAIPATFTSARPHVQVDDWREDSWRWVPITTPELVSALLRGTCRLVSFGPGVGTSSTYYGKFGSHTATPAGTARPRLRLTYAK